MKKGFFFSLFLIFIVAFIFLACNSNPSSSSDQITITIKNDTWTIEVKVYNGDEYLGSISAGDSQQFTINKGHVLI